MAAHQDKAEVSHPAPAAPAVVSDGMAARRTTSALLMRPEEIAGGPELASLFFDVPLIKIQKWCPLEERDLIAPFLEKIGRCVYEAFGLNPCLLGCVLCLASGIKKKDAANLATVNDRFRNIRVFYAEARVARGEEKDRLFAPGARILSERCS